MCTGYQNLLLLQTAAGRAAATGVSHPLSHKVYRWAALPISRGGSMQVRAAKEQLEALGYTVRWGLDVGSTAADWRKLWMQW